MRYLYLLRWWRRATAELGDDDVERGADDDVEGTV